MKLWSGKLYFKARKKYSLFCNFFLNICLSCSSTREEQRVKVNRALLKDIRNEKEICLLKYIVNANVVKSVRVGGN